VSGPGTFQKFVEMLKDYGNSLYFENHVPFFQMVSNLMGTPNQTFELSGELMHQNDSAREWSRTGNEMVILQQMYLHRMILAYFFKDLELAGQMSQTMWSPYNEGPAVGRSSFVCRLA
jgi:hypothetical protein